MPHCHDFGQDGGCAKIVNRGQSRSLCHRGDDGLEFRKQRDPAILAQYPNTAAWAERLRIRPAVGRGMMVLGG